MTPAPERLNWTQAAAPALAFGDATGRYAPLAKRDGAEREAEGRFRVTSHGLQRTYVKNSCLHSESDLTYPARKFSSAPHTNQFNYSVPPYNRLAGFSMARTKSKTNLEALRQQQLELVKKIKEAEAEEKQKEQEKDERRKLLAGAVALAELEENPSGAFARPSCVGSMIA